MPDQQGADDKKTTKEVVNKKQKQMMGEEGYDIARDEGRVSPAKDKKDGTTAPRKGMTAKERKKAMQQAQQRSQIAVNNVVTALRKKYGKDAVMYTQKTSKAKSNEEFDLTQVAESLGGYIVEAEKKPKPRSISNPLTYKQMMDRQRDADLKRLSGRKLRRQKQFADIMKNIPGAENLPPRKLRNISKFMNDPSFKGAKADKEIRRQLSQIDRAKGGTGVIDARVETRGRPRAGSTYRKDLSGTMKAKQKLRTDKLVKKLEPAKKLTKSVAGKVSGAADTAVSTARGLGKITKAGIVNPTFDKFRDSASQAKKIATSVQAPKVGKAGATVADMGKTALGKVRSGLSVGSLKSVGKTAGKKLFGKGGALAAKTIGRAGAKFGAKRIYGVGSAIAGAEAIGRFAAGDVVGGTLAGAEAITGLIPGIGTGVSAGLGALGLARDLKRTKQVVGAVRKAKKLRKFKPVTRGLVGQKSNLNKVVKGSISPKNRTSTAVGLAGAGAVGSTVSDRRRNRLRLPSIPSPTLTGGSAGFRTAG